MATINVKALDTNTFQVTVDDGTTTSHTVTVLPEYAEKLTAGNVPVSQLIQRSFDFLLERESNTSILRSFDLSVIGHYFPEYETVISKMLG